MKTPKWLEPDNVKQRSQKQEKKLAKMLNGITTINSGALWQKNDVIAKNFSVEAKTTKYKSYQLHRGDLKKTEKHALKQDKLPMFIIDFEDRETYGVLSMGDIMYLLEKAGML